MYAILSAPMASLSRMPSLMLGTSDGRARDAEPPDPARSRAAAAPFGGPLRPSIYNSPPPPVPYMQIDYGVFLYLEHLGKDCFTRNDGVFAGAKSTHPCRELEIGDQRGN